MPDEYVAMRDSFKKKGMSDKAAKAKAAAIYNSKHKEHPVGRYTEQLVGGGGNEGNEQGIGPASPTTSKTLKKPKPPEKSIKKPDEIKPVDTTMKEELCKFMEDRAERLYQDAKHSGKIEKGNVVWRRVKHTPTHIKRVGEWPDEIPSRSPINKAMKHGERQAVKRDIAKDPESV